MQEAAQQTIHGVFVDVFGQGILIVGESGIGKSELGLGLISNGHRLVADDCVCFHKNPSEQLVGTCSPLLQDFLEVRGLGILNIRSMFGDTSIQQQKRLQLSVRIVIVKQSDLADIDRFHGVYSEITILGVTIPEVTIPVAPGRNLAVLTEAAVRQHLLKNTGYDAPQAFSQRQKQFMDQK